MNEQQAFKVLNASEEYQVLMRLEQVDTYQIGQPEQARLVMVLDVETTGLDTAADKIIELGFVVCRYNSDSGALYDVMHRYDGFEDPGEAISDVVRKLTGIDDAMVQGQHLDDAVINAWLNRVDLVVAHNAGFDRKMVERRLPAAANCNWACSFKGIDWQAEGIASAKLDYLAYRFGFFFAGHRAVNDAEATLHLLSMPLPKSNQFAMQTLLKSAGKPYARIFLRGTDYTQKELLKSHQYQWSPGNKLWHKLILEQNQDAELDWLDADIYKGGKADVTIMPLTAKDMYSVREGV